MNELISVIIPCYNRRGTLPESMASVLNQTYSNIELIVVDDGSTDDTEILFENISDPRVRYIRYTPNQGACHARNVGIMNASGAYIALQDSDDVWHPDKLEKQMEFLCKAGTEMVFCGMNRVSAEGSAFYFPMHPLAEKNVTAQLLAENRVGTQTILMKAEAAKDVLFDESFRRYQDWDFAVRFSMNHTMAYQAEALVESPVGNDSISDTVKSYPALQHLYAKHEALYTLYPQSAGIMHRRMAMRMHKSSPAIAAKHFKECFSRTHKWYDFAYYLGDSIRSIFTKGSVSL